MHEEHEIFLSENASLPGLSISQSRNISKAIRHQRSILECLHLRSQALEKRLRNEIGLAFNVVAQHDSRIAVRIGEATQVDSAAMKTISVLGLIFLPGTFISVSRLGPTPSKSHHHANTYERLFSV